MSSVATFGSGCFWCTEACFQQLRGVESVVSGYCGGEKPNPTYHQVCTGQTGHAEVIQVTFDPDEISYADLLNAFFKTHDPTTLNRQGNDVGTQYRSAIFWHDESQRKLAEAYVKELDEAGVFGAPIVTQICEACEFFPAEDYHQSYYQQNSAEGYCQFVIVPKLKKFQLEFADKLRDRS
ncbi:MAG: peptide-methionine (S)-S-oxide reductase MsrA [Planctomycetota bacterium]|nr:peptide-methionine (S)-S-oxide reductase MsrA [Planctomycetota bacterium]MDA1250047.1 peptide-methionine (S)-S-oxide reductase MsrA [Planctomycetota bacterium]